MGQGGCAAVHLPVWLQSERRVQCDDEEEGEEGGTA